ncbi:pilus assembly protein [Pseudomonas sp. ABC1]|uniref:TadE/TadG family type IV pilus assembly protein n=1 Tax=Pseudomonas sp. ABC1 TaxID=2748080 RepID=UPI0015C31290|nr:pilus assembly protein [Pseudomonas sp. ABC1]QLF92015.1 pilus assembly protein [Pseudomonas sp. ABC1]
MKAFNPRRQRGSAVLETALIMPLVIGVAVISADLYSVHQARGYMELSAHTIASVLSNQSRLDYDGLQALVDQAASKKALGDYELVISQVALDRNMAWKPLYRGSVGDLCPSQSEGLKYTGEMPEEVEEDPDNPSKTSLVVVQLCRNSSNLALSSGLLVDKEMHAIAFNRMLYNELELDEVLASEVGLRE